MYRVMPLRTYGLSMTCLNIPNRFVEPSKRNSPTKNSIKYVHATCLLVVFIVSAQLSVRKSLFHSLAGGQKR